MMSTTHAKISRSNSGAAHLAGIAARLRSDTPLRITGLGDSLTYGWMVELGFFDRFVDQLNAAFPACPIQKINAGIPGDTAEGGLHRVGDLVAGSPDIVTVQFGLNDMNCGIAVADFRATLETIVERILRASAVPVLVTSCPLDWEEGQQLAGTFYDGIRDVARFANVPCASLDLYWQEIAGAPSGWAGLVQADRLHPTDKGHALMADGLFDLVVGQEKEPRYDL